MLQDLYGFLGGCRIRKAAPLHPFSHSIHAQKKEGAGKENYFLYSTPPIFLLSYTPKLQYEDFHIIYITSKMKIQKQSFRSQRHILNPQRNRTNALSRYVRNVLDRKSFFTHSKSIFLFPLYPARKQSDPGRLHHHTRLPATAYRLPPPSRFQSQYRPCGYYFCASILMCPYPVPAAPFPLVYRLLPPLIQPVFLHLFSACIPVLEILFHPQDIVAPVTVPALSILHPAFLNIPGNPLPRHLGQWM